METNGLSKKQNSIIDLLKTMNAYGKNKAISKIETLYILKHLYFKNFETIKSLKELSKMDKYNMSAYRHLTNDIKAINDKRGNSTDTLLGSISGNKGGIFILTEKEGMEELLRERNEIFRKLKRNNIKIGHAKLNNQMKLKFDELTKDIMETLKGEL